MTDEPRASSRRTRTTSTGAFAVLGARIALLLLAVALAASGFLLARARGDDARVVGGAKFTCPMHPEVVSETPGDCPLCHMALVALEPAARAAHPRGPAHSSAGEEPFSLPRDVRPAEHQRLGAVERRVFTSPVIAPAWLDADGTARALLHGEELIGLSPGDAARFFAARSPRDGLRAIRLDEEPERRQDGSVVVGFRIEPGVPEVAPASAPASADVGWLKIDAKSRELSLIPLSAVLHGVDGPFVLVAQADRQSFVRRPVRIGRIYAGRVAVLDGLDGRELIALGNVFLLDAERRHARRIAEVGR
jgi:hypothetical protein